MTGNVIFIHPDGASPSHFGAARFASVGPDGRLNWDLLTEAGVYLGHLDDRVVATSNGGAVTHAYGIKSVASSFGFDGEGEQYISLAGEQGLNVGNPQNTVLEDAIEVGRPTAIINSGFIAEPGTGVFAASALNRGETEEITAQIIESGVNVILGGGETDYLPEGTVGFFGEEGTRTDGRNLIEEAEALGYTVVFTLEELQAVPAGTENLLGIFAASDTYNDIPEGALIENGFVEDNGELIFYGQSPFNPNPPTIAEMLQATLDLTLFQEEDEGFLIVLEEEATDNFGNNNNAAGVIEATLRADEAIGVAIDFVNNVNSETLIITAADSDAGGLEVDDTFGETVGTAPYQREIDDITGEQFVTQVPRDGQTGSGTAPFVTGAPDSNGDFFEFGVAWAGLPDFAGSIVSKAFGYNSELLPATVDNTGIYRIIYETLFDVALEPPEGVPEDPTPAPAPTQSTGGVIFIHPDGTSPSHYAAARFSSVGTDGRLNWDRLTEAGVYLGHIDDRIVGTSNTGAVIHAYGVRNGADNDSFGLDINGEQILSAAGTPNTITEDAIAAGLPTALINSGFIAEPGTGVFAASVADRGETEDITVQIIESGVNVILGGGETDYLPEGTVGFFGEEGTRTDGRNLIEEAEALGYEVVFTLEELQAVAPDTELLLGIFGAEDTYNDTFEDNLRQQGLVDENGDIILYGQPPLNTDPPTIAEMLEATLNLNLFAQAEDGFLVVLEEEATDNFGNNNNAVGVIEATLRADEAIGVAIDFVDNVNPNTLILTAADSDGGGLEVIDVPVGAFGDPEGTSVNVQSELVSFGGGSDGIPVAIDDQTGNGDDVFEPFVTGAPDANGDTFEFGVVWSGLPDVAGSIVSRAYGLNSELLPATLDNTEIYALTFQTLFGRTPEEVAPRGPIFGNVENNSFETGVEGFDGLGELLFTGDGFDSVDISDSFSLFGNNRIYLGADDDIILAGEGDRIFGGDENDIIDASEGGGGNRLYGGEGDDEILVGFNDFAFGGEGNDTLDASQGGGGNRLYGGEGDDDFILGEGDRLLGREGDDSFFATEGGNNVITGGEGTDAFWVVNAGIPESANTITDFDVIQDVIGIGGLGDSPNLEFNAVNGDTTLTVEGNLVAIFSGVDIDVNSANIVFA